MLYPAASTAIFTDRAISAGHESTQRSASYHFCSIYLCVQISLSPSLSLYVYIYIYIHIYIYICTHIFVCIYIYIYIYMLSLYFCFIAGPSGPEPRRRGPIGAPFIILYYIIYVLCMYYITYIYIYIHVYTHICILYHNTVMT